MTPLKTRYFAIIPGFGESPSDPAYRNIAEYARANGWTPLPLPIRWKRTAFDGWVRQATDIIGDRKISGVFGFSFGALIGIQLAQSNDVSTFIAASPSPYFKEQLHMLPPLATKILGEFRIKSFAKHSLRDVTTAKIKDLITLVGTADFPLLVSEAPNFMGKAQGRKKLIKVKNAPHMLENVHYQAAVKKILASKKPGT